jgi:hypothetical protein
MTAKEILYEIKDKHNIGTAWQLTEHIIIEAMEEYADQQVRKSNVPVKINSLSDLDGKTIPVHFTVKKWQPNINIDIL